MKCIIEMVLYDSKRWYNIFDAIHPQRLAVRYDETIFVVFNNGHLKKIKEDKITKKITYRASKEVDCRSILISRIWLDNSIDSSAIFKNAREFCKMYVSACTMGDNNE